MIAWNPAFGMPYESAWGLVQKLAWLNVVNPCELLSRPLGFKRPLIAPQHDIRTFVVSDWMSKASGRSAIGAINRTINDSDGLLAMLRGCTGDALIGWRASSLMTSHLRICPECIRVGYHSILHQLEGLRCCLLDGASLIDWCPHCRRSLPDFGLRPIEEGFRCPDCCKSFLNGALSKPQDEWRERVERLVAPLVAWLRSFDNEHIVFPSRHALPYIRAEDQPLTRALKNAQALLGVMHRIRPCPVATNVRAPLPAGLIVESRLTDPVPPKVDTFARDEAQLRSVCERIASSISRVASHLTRLLAGHERCIHAASQMLALHTEYGGLQLFDAPALCTMAQAFYLWRARVAAFERDIAESAETSWIPAYEEAGLGRLPRELMSTFYHCAASLAFLRAWRCEGQEISETLLDAWREVNTTFWITSPNLSFFGREASERFPMYDVFMDDPGVLEFGVCDQGEEFRAHQQNLHKLLHRIDWHTREVKSCSERHFLRGKTAHAEATRGWAAELACKFKEQGSKRSPSR